MDIEASGGGTSDRFAVAFPQPQTVNGARGVVLDRGGRRREVRRKTVAPLDNDSECELDNDSELDNGQEEGSGSPKHGPSRILSRLCVPALSTCDSIVERCVASTMLMLEVVRIVPHRRSPPLAWPNNFR
jgi:hypothetical protein